MTISAVDATQELAVFLRTRREQLDPDALGLPARRATRRTPGLRREEVAELAGVSVDYVVRLEQARGPRPSADVLDALARALRLPPVERAYLFDLAQPRPRTADAPTTIAAPPLARLVDDLAPLPAMLLNHRYDILAWNREMAALLLDFGALPPGRRNAMWLCLAHPELSARYADRERVVREGVAHLRAAWAAHPQDPVLTGLIDELHAADAEFARLWAARDITVGGRGHKVLHHPEAGPLALDAEVLAPLHDPDQRLLLFRAANDASRAALKRLSGS
ncbi:helix-turn-helix transcriptional regulator [Streptomyces sp. NPDC048416]|uniref:helix-turn-helix transcriptional regulator n=1 Tax=Streptomyces sp. NPDC048416 TaxID=3365546 RepID=UPI003715F5FE